MILSRFVPTLRQIASTEIGVYSLSSSSRLLSSLSTIETRMTPLSQNISDLNFSNSLYPIQSYRFLHYSRCTASPKGEPMPDPFPKDDENQAAPFINPKISMKRLGQGAAAAAVVTLGLTLRLYISTTTDTDKEQTVTLPPPGGDGGSGGGGSGGSVHVKQIQTEGPVATEGGVVTGPNSSVTQTNINTDSIPKKKKA